MTRVNPLSLGKTSRSVTRQHRALVWENMLGTVYAQDPVSNKVKYFDYDWEAAVAYAKVKECTDLRTARNTQPTYLDGPRTGQKVLYGVPPKQ